MSNIGGVQIFQRSKQLVDNVFDMVVVDQRLSKLFLPVQHLLQTDASVARNNITKKL